MVFPSIMDTEESSTKLFTKHYKLLKLWNVYYLSLLWNYLTYQVYCLCFLFWELNFNFPCNPNLICILKRSRRLKNAKGTLVWNRLGISYGMILNCLYPLKNKLHYNFHFKIIVTYILIWFIQIFIEQLGRHKGD